MEKNSIETMDFSDSYKNGIYFKRTYVNSNQQCDESCWILWGGFYDAFSRGWLIFCFKKRTNFEKTVTANTIVARYMHDIVLRSSLVSAP